MSMYLVMNDGRSGKVPPCSTSLIMIFHICMACVFLSIVISGLEAAGALSSSMHIMVIITEEWGLPVVVWPGGISSLVAAVPCAVGVGDLLEDESGVPGVYTP